MQNSLKNLKLEHCGPIRKAPFGHNGQEFGASNDEVAIFSQKWSPLSLDFKWKLIKKFKLVSSSYPNK